MQVSTMQTKYRRRAVKKNSTRPTLRNQKLRRVQQETVIYCQRAPKRSLETESQSDSVGPVRAQVCCINGREKIARRHWRGIILTKQIANPAENVATIVKRNCLH